MYVHYIHVQLLLTEEFTDKWFGLEWLHLINVFSSTNECDGTSCGCHAEREGGGREQGRREGRRGRSGERREGGEGGGERKGREEEREKKRMRREREKEGERGREHHQKTSCIRTLG